MTKLFLGLLFGVSFLAVAAGAADLESQVNCKIDDPGTLADLGGIKAGQLMDVQSFAEADGTHFSNMLIDGNSMLEGFPFAMSFSAPDTAPNFVLQGKVVNDAEQKTLTIGITGALGGEGKGNISVLFQERNTGDFVGNATVKECARLK